MAKNLCINPNFERPQLLEDWVQYYEEYDPHNEGLTIAPGIGRGTWPLTPITGGRQENYDEYAGQVFLGVGKGTRYFVLLPYFPCSPGDEFWFSSRIRLFQQSAGGSVSLATWFNTSFTEIKPIKGSEHQSVALTATGAGQPFNTHLYRPEVYSGRAPIGAVSMTAAFVCTAPVAGSETSFTFGETMVTEDESIGGVYFDGNSPGCRWMGLKEASESDNMADNALYERVLPVYAYDEQHGFFGRYLCDAIMSMLQGLDAIVQDTPHHPGWGVILDPATCPPAWLPWCAQLYGVVLEPGMNVMRQRQTILESPQQRRGTTEQLIKEIQKTLTGLKWVGYQEQAEGHAYRLGIQTQPAETPSIAATEEAIARFKPGGLKGVYSPAGVSWAEATKKYSEVGAAVTWENVKVGDV